MMNIIITFCLLGNLFSATTDTCHLIIFYSIEQGKYRSIHTSHFHRADWSTVQQISRTLYDQTFAALTLNPDISVDQVTPDMLTPDRRHCIGKRRLLLQSEEINEALAQLEGILQKYHLTDGVLQAEDVQKIRTQPRTWVLVPRIDLQGGGSVFIACDGQRYNLEGFISSGDTLQDQQAKGLDLTTQAGCMSLLEVKRYIESNNS